MRKLCQDIKSYNCEMYDGLNEESIINLYGRKPSYKKLDNGTLLIRSSISDHSIPIGYYVVDVGDWNPKILSAEEFKENYEIIEE